MTGRTVRTGRARHCVAAESAWNLTTLTHTTRPRHWRCWSAYSLYTHRNRRDKDVAAGAKKRDTSGIPNSTEFDIQSADIKSRPSRVLFFIIDASNCLWIERTRTHTHKSSVQTFDEANRFELTYPAVEWQWHAELIQLGANMCQLLSAITGHRKHTILWYHKTPDGPVCVKAFGCIYI